MLSFLPSEHDVLMFIDGYGMYLFVLPFLLSTYWYRRRTKIFKRLVLKKEEELGKKLPRCLYCHWVLFKPPWYEDAELKNKHYKYCWEVHFIMWGSVLLIVLFGFFVVTFMDVSEYPRNT